MLEEAQELSDAEKPEDVAWEAADVIYFALVKAAKHGVTLADIEAQLNARSLKVTRRKGDAKVPLATEPKKAEPVATEPVAEVTSSTAPLLKHITPDQIHFEEVEPVDNSILPIVKDIVDNVKKNGEKAVIQYATKFGDIKEGKNEFS